tara:strand:- start:757 stop:1185 length:429 start_codon:yes stop_codon:yes gene_type:complete
MVKPFVFVPMHELMCVDLSKSELLRERGPLYEEELPDFFMLTRIVFDRWHELIGVMAPTIYTQYHSLRGTIKDLESQMHRVFDEDGPEAFEERRRFWDMLDAFDSLMERLASAFDTPSDIGVFYYNISERIRKTMESHLEMM